MSNRPVGQLCVVILMCSLAVAGLRVASAQGPTVDELDWIKQSAIPFDTVEAGHGFTDLEPLQALIGDARIVSLGESTHGSREIFQMKHRLVEFLASEMGFTIFSIEANMPEAYRVNAYVLGGDGDAASLIGGMYFWTWNTHEVFDMVQWMRRFNAAGRGRIEFTGFDMQTPDVAMQVVLKFLQGADEELHAKAQELYGNAQRARPGAPNQFAVATGSFPVDAARGKRVTFQGWIKTDNVRDGFAGLWWRADGPNGEVLAFNNMADQRVTGTRDWEPYAIELNVPNETSNINFGVLMPGKGKAWFDALEVKLDGEPYRNAALFDFDFEGPVPKGLAPMANATLDGQIAKSGKRSLRLESGGSPAGATSPEQFREVVASSRSILNQLEKNRDELVTRFDRAEVDWSIQNARVVDQALRQRAGDMRVRDASMADNVEWILQQNPDAKIVLWAHNGHVAKQPLAMGSYLDKKFGPKHLAIGFATTEGEYQAMGSGGLGVHPLQTPPPSSIEAAFRQTGMPQFMLDLRKARDLPVAAWIAKPLPFRSIGALAMDNQFFPADLPKIYDAVIYLEKTTAAKPLR